MREQASYEVTDMAYNTQQGQRQQFKGDEQLWVKFHVLPMLDQEKSDQEGRPIYKDVEHIQIMAPGNKDSVIDRPITVLDRKRFARHYAAWKADEKELIEGTPLASVARDPIFNLSPAKIEELKYFKIVTVEQLANLSDANAQQHMGINIFRKAAQEYLKKSDQHATVTRLQSELEQRDSRLQAMEQALADLQARLAEAEAPKGRRSSPPKVPC